jgi:putative phage-type endonuclease
MKFVTAKQNTKEWREWRGKGLGASDAPAVMGESPWTSPFELWLQKTGLGERPPANEFQVAAMKRGTELEPIARAMFEKEIGAAFETVSAYSEQYEFLRASFDGYNKDLNAILEIKCPGKDDHAKALKGKVPTKYMAQLQQQLYISEARVCYYYSWDGKSDKGAIVEVKPDLNYQQKLLEAAIDFWARVQNKIPPDITAKDVKKVVDQMQKSLKQVNQCAEVLALITKDDK